jgi:signal transduction histidine kinase
MAQLREIANQTLGVARQTRVPKTSDLAALTEAAIRIHQKTISDKKIHLVKDMTEGVTASVYTSEILQVISNLIMNSLDALPPDGMLRLRLRKRRDEVHLVVADTGRGIDAEHAANIFKPFFTTKEERGIGLGLALSKKIVERHRGRISMRSSVQAGKSGTIFRIALPA